MSRPLLAVDGDNFAHRSYHALPKTIRRTDGHGGGAIVGFANFLLRLYDGERPRAVLVGWDTLSAPTYRQDLWNTVTAPMRTIAGMMSSHETEQAGPAPEDLFSGRYADAGETGPVAGPSPEAMKAMHMAPAGHEHSGHPH